MSNIPPPRIPSQNRLYKGLITTLEILKFVGFVFVAFYCLLIFLLYSAFYRQYGLILASTSFLLGCIIVYVTTQVLIAIIDLLSRIEENTR